MAEKINVAELDKFDPKDFVIPITFQVSDFREPENRKGSVSKTIKLPGTKRNDTIFSNYYKPNAEGIFDANKRSEAFLQIGSNRLLEGGLHLRAARIDNGRIHSYEVVLLGDNTAWFDLIKDKNIQDIKLETIEFTAQVVEDSWTNNGDSLASYVFPLINYGRLTILSRFTNPLLTNDFRPAIFVKKILREIFRDIGYQFNSSFFDQLPYRDLIIPFTTGDLELSQEIQDQQIGHMSRNVPVAADDVDNMAQLPTLGENRISYDTTITDEGGNLSRAVGSYTAPYDGRYNIRAVVKGALRKKLSQSNINVTAVFIVERAAGGTERIENIISFTQQGFGIFVISFEFNDIGPSELEMKEGDFITLFLGVDPEPSKLGYQFAELEVTPIKLEFGPGGEIDLESTLPDMDQGDFVKGLMQMFNLYAITDNRRKTITFETRDTFFKDIDEGEDWTEKLDRSRRMRLEPILEGLSKTLEWKYADDDKDENVVQYEVGVGKKLGNITEELENELLKGKKEIASLPFAATGMGSTFGGALYTPVITEDFNTAENTFEFGPKILIYGGLVDSATYSWQGAPQSQYAFAYFTPQSGNYLDVDLDFTSRSFFGYTNSFMGLKDRFYRRQLNQINKGRFATFYIKLSDNDIASLDFRTPKLIDGNWYYINKIKDYKAGADESTEVELLQKIN